MITVNKLLEQLEDKYPNQLPTSVVDMTTITTMMGQQEVISYIINLIEEDEYRSKSNDNNRTSR